MNWLYLSLAIAMEVSATSALKASDGFARLLLGCNWVIGLRVNPGILE